MYEVGEVDQLRTNFKPLPRGMKFQASTEERIRWMTEFVAEQLSTLGIKVRVSNEQAFQNPEAVTY